MLTFWPGLHNTHQVTVWFICFRLSLLYQHSHCRLFNKPQLGTESGLITPAILLPPWAWHLPNMTNLSNFVHREIPLLKYLHSLALNSLHIKWEQLRSYITTSSEQEQGCSTNLLQLEILWSWVFSVRLRADKRKGRCFAPWKTPSVEGRGITSLIPAGWVLRKATRHKTSLF